MRTVSARTYRGGLMAHIFISYNRQSKALVTTLADDLEALGHTVWFDQQLSGGQVWWNQILTTVRDCDLFVFVVDPEALHSTACQREYGYAADLGKPILPVLVSEGVSMNLLPPALSQIQLVDYRAQDRIAAIRLARALMAIPPPPPLPDPLPRPPEAPISYLGSLSEQIETTSILSYAEQSTLVVDLKRGLRDPQTRDDTRTLLERLRRRRDLLATIAEEIDELLGSPRTAQSAPPTPSENQLLAGQKPPRSVPPNIQTSTDHTPTRQERVRGALSGAILGTVAGMIAMSTASSFSFDWPLGFFTGVGGAIAGTLSGTHRREIGVVLLSAAFGWLLVALLWEDSSACVAAGGVFGAPSGAI